MGVVVGLIVGVVLLVVIFVVMPADKGWVVTGPLWMLAGALCLAFGIGVEIGAISGPGVSLPPVPLAAVAFLVCLVMILNGALQVWTGLYEQGTVRRRPPGH
jgi:hypothetical protein